MPSAARKAEGGAIDRPPRPRGPLIWAHAADPDRVQALIQLAIRAEAQRPGLNMLITVAEDRDLPVGLPPHVLTAVAPRDQTTDCTDFMAHWRPDVGVWHTGHLRPSLLGVARHADLPMILVDATEEGFAEPRMSWLRRKDRSALSVFEVIYVTSGNAGRLLTRIGAPADRIEVTGHLQEGTAALPCNEDTRTDMAETLATRPIWLAAMVQPDEFPTVIEAHRQAIRAAHRLMLILVPLRPEDGDVMCTSLTDQGLRHIRWSDGGYPEETTQVLIADTFGEMGLWYRLSPVTFMGSSLTAGHGGRDPYEPAALGSAILYGPNVSRHIQSYSRFARAGAARMVKDAATLSAAVLRLNAPDQAAVMAQAAWEVATEGAEVTDKVLERLETILDRRPQRHASP
ncbi:3-deoxy-D-manno-octulosonic acid transferase [Pseudooceanicola onchidii]|uniref:3-deoxy-D-manno-octulosonic acid transferase n=1 Tax=Pseudooceanicola onchidii TaxID=2562279 RepID=UPI0010AA9822|nr:glycosyltransferase N-terminal domain-containing protein [Pseudooceanicola onchidii]